MARKQNDHDDDDFDYCRSTDQLKARADLPDGGEFAGTKDCSKDYDKARAQNDCLGIPVIPYDKDYLNI